MISNAFSWSLSCRKVVMATAVNLLFNKPHLKTFLTNPTLVTVAVCHIITSFYRKYF